jgi:hypothetical protein
MIGFILHPTGSFNEALVFIGAGAALAMWNWPPCPA